VIFIARFLLILQIIIRGQDYEVPALFWPFWPQYFLCQDRNPVKNRDALELNDSESLTPQMINKIPTTNSATETPLFIYNTPSKCAVVKAASGL